MTYLRTMIGLGLGLAGLWLTGCAGGPTAGNQPGIDEPAAVVDSPTATLIVYGMSCPLCANNVDKQLLDVPGVSGVNVDMGTGEAKVRFLPGARVTKQQLSDAINKSGFTLAELRVP
ncbi:MAG: heavy-metal-associated domain-containing protein [Planctomycetota bacterium]